MTLFDTILWKMLLLTHDRLHQVLRNSNRTYDRCTRDPVVGDPILPHDVNSVCVIDDENVKCDVDGGGILLVRNKDTV